MTIILIFLISLCKCEYILFIKTLYLSNIILRNNYINNLSILLDLYGKEVPNDIISNNVLNIILDSGNLNEKKKNDNIIFECNFLGATKDINAYMNCSLKNSIPLNIKGQYFFREEFFKKSFNIEDKGKILNFTLELSNYTFYLSMIENFTTKKTLFNNIFKYHISNIIIPIAMSLDDGYLYPTIVAITSILENSYKSTKYDFYIMHPGEFTIDNQIKLKNIEKKYNRCSINLIDMGDKYKTEKIRGYITTPAYYRLSLPDLLPNINKMIYLDGDILAFVDLKEMYDFEMEGYYYKGFLDILQDSFNPENDIYICSGVLLINLEELRKDDMVNVTNTFMKNNKERLLKERYHDQPIINALCFRKIGILPAKFGVFNYNSLEILYIATRTYRYKHKYSKEELKNAYFNPKILHYNKIKPWKIRNNTQTEIWWEYAKKSNYYEEMCKKFELCGNKKPKLQKNEKKPAKKNIFKNFFKVIKSIKGKIVKILLYLIK